MSADIDPLLKDLSEKKQSLRRNVVSLAAELKDVRSRLALQENSCANETLTRKEAETRAKTMEGELFELQKCLEERNDELQASALVAQKHIEIEELRSQLSTTQAIAEASAASAQSAQFQCLTLRKELDKKNYTLKEHETRVHQLEEQLDLLHKDLQLRESSQKQLKDEVLRVENDIMEAISKTGMDKDCELTKVSDDVSSSRNYEKINQLINLKDEEIEKLRDEIRITSSYWKLKTEDLESQMEKHRRADQELKKRVLRLDFCLQEARSQTGKLQRIGERRYKTMKELRDHLMVKKQDENEVKQTRKNIWETTSFKIVASMSMLLLVLFSNPIKK